jgi:hypothetical protein
MQSSFGLFATKLNFYTIYVTCVTWIGFYSEPFISSQRRSTSWDSKLNSVLHFIDGLLCRLKECSVGYNLLLKLILIVSICYKLTVSIWQCVTGFVLR